MTNAPRTVLVTGTTSGIGRAAVSMLASRGFRVFAGYRGVAPDFSAEVEAAAHQPIEPVELDVTSDDDVARAVERLEAVCPDGLYGLVNNAGIGAPSAVELTHVDELRRLFEVNSVAPLRMIQAFLPLLRRRQGRIVNMSSMNGTIALPMVGAYSASKFALEALSDALRVELRPWGIKVVLVQPGQIKTAIFDKAREALASRSAQIPSELGAGYNGLYARAATFNERGAKAATGPSAVAWAVFKALNARFPRTRYVVGFDSWGLQAMRWAFPTWALDRILAAASGIPRQANRKLQIDSRTTPTDLDEKPSVSDGDLSEKTSTAARA